jgi:hypothetical protein
MQAEYGAPKSGYSWGPTRSAHAEGHSGYTAMARGRRPWRGRRPLHAGKHGERNPGGPASGLARYGAVRTVNPRGTTVTHGGRESDSFIVPRKPSTKGCPQGPAEKGEGRELAQGNGAE